MTSPLSLPGPNTLEALIQKNSPAETARFIDGASVVRAALEAHDQGSTLTITPLRGAMPVVWASQGLETIEEPSDTVFVETPIGEYVYRQDGRVRSTSPKEFMKRRILDYCITEALTATGFEPAKTNIRVLDEVQKGGTLSTAVRLTREIASKKGIKPFVRVVAAQDSRRRVMAESKTSPYRNLASNSIKDTPTTVVPMPMIATDRTVLLDTVLLEGAQNDWSKFPERLTVARNEKACMLFSTLGSLARNDELRHDSDFLREFIDAQGEMGMKAANRIEGWMQHLVDIQDRATE